MPTLVPPAELTAIIDDLKHRLQCAHVTGVRINPHAQGLAVVGQIFGQQTAAAIRRCCDEVSRQYGIDIFVSCRMI